MDVVANGVKNGLNGNDGDQPLKRFPIWIYFLKTNEDGRLKCKVGKEFALHHNSN